MNEKLTYKLYRNLHDIINPTISRKNISNYDIVIDEDLVPLQVFYPEISEEKSNIIVYVPNKIKDYSTYEQLAKRTGNIILCIKYNMNNAIDDCYKIIKYIYDNISDVDLSTSNITLMSDCKGSNIINEVINKIINDNYAINKMILLDPENIDNLSNSINKKLIIYSDKEDTIKKDEYKYIPNLYEDFFYSNGLATREYLYNMINEYLTN